MKENYINSLSEYYIEKLYYTYFKSKVPSKTNWVFFRYDDFFFIEFRTKRKISNKAIIKEISNHVIEHSISSHDDKYFHTFKVSYSVIRFLKIKDILDI